MQKPKKSSKKVCKLIFSILTNLEVLGKLLDQALGALLAVFYQGLKNMKDNNLMVYVSINHTSSAT